MAGWIVRAHHAPGLPERVANFAGGHKLRGRRWDDGPRHLEQIARTDECMERYLADHEEAVGAAPVEKAQAEHGLTMRLALSCLVDADHEDTASFCDGFTLPSPPDTRWRERLEKLDDYVRQLPNAADRERTEHRARFYRECRNSPETDAMIACEGPVGIGKTTAVTAYLIQRCIKEELRHLFIVAPYTNIISQTVDVLREALVLADEDPMTVITEHHHQADFESLEKRGMAVLWRSPIIVTTAVQLFETLAANNPSQLRKLHELPGSAVFIDESHAALPTRLWPQNWRWLRELASDWRCRFVFASGSLAKFWENDDVIEEPVKLPELMTSDLIGDVLPKERRRARIKKKGRFESAEVLVRAVAESPGPRLVIMNTVQSAAVVARLMKKEHEVFHLSTALTPRDREKILAQVKKRLKRCDKTNWMLVGTSCIEAGLNLSFRTAFRERFSVASLIQVSGRVNRGGEFGEEGASVVYDFLIDSGNGITEHREARVPGEVVKRQLRNGNFDCENITPAELMTRAMAEEIRDIGGLNCDLLSKAERAKNYPEAANQGQVIRANTRVVVVDEETQQQIENGKRVPFHDILNGSVQIWEYKARELKLQQIGKSKELFAWSYDYDPDSLGIMAGVLKISDLQQRGYAIV